MPECPYCKWVQKPDIIAEYKGVSYVECTNCKREFEVKSESQKNIEVDDGND